MMLNRLGLSLALVLPGVALAESPWLYLSPDGGWVSQTVEPTGAEPHTLALPSSAETVWVENEGSLDYWLRERHAEPADLAAGADLWIPPSVGSRAGLSAGDYEVVQVLPFGVSARPMVDPDQLVIVPQEVLSASEITVAQAPVDRLRLFGAGTEPRQVAWSQTQLSANVRYRLDVQSEHQGVLTQALLIENRGSALQVRGLSFRDQGSARPGPVLAMSQTSARADAPAEQVAGQTAVITSKGERELPGQAQLVLPVTRQEVRLNNHYRHDLHLANATQARPAARTLRLTVAGSGALPRISGALSLNWFDSARARQQSRFSAGHAERVDLELPRSSLVSASLTFSAATQTGELSVSNRTESAQDWQVRISWHQDNQRHTAELQARLPAGESVWRLQRVRDELRFVARDSS